MISKVTIEEGKGEYFAVPSIDGPVLEDGNATFFYRDPELFLTSDMDKIENVQLKITANDNADVYDMEYDEVNEYWDRKSVV